MLHNDHKAKLRKENLVLRVDREAQFYVERRGIFFQDVYRFQCKKGLQKIIHRGSWTKVQYQFLLAKQKKEPVPLTTDYKSGRTWWIFQDQFYWEDYSAKELSDKQRKRSDVMIETQALFFRGTKAVYGISSTIFRFHCSLAQRGKTLTEEQHQSLLKKQREDPVQLLSDRKSGRKWWMFRDKIYWEDANLNENEVKAFLLERRRDEGQESRRHTYRKSLPNSVKLLVWERDRGQCVKCGRDEELEFDHIIPVSKGGSNTEKNIQLLCAACNRSKGANLV